MTTTNGGAVKEYDSVELSERFDDFFRERGWDVSKTVHPSGFIEYSDTFTDHLWTGFRCHAEIARNPSHD